MEFSVTKSNGRLIPPSGTTPSGMLELSRIDRLPVLRCNARTLHVFGPYGPPGAAQSVISDALSKALVPYYPLAGRLKEEYCFSGGSESEQEKEQKQKQLYIKCTGEGVWFVEAMADCSLSSLGYFDDVSSIPFDKLLPHHPPETQGIDPLVLMQVTEFEDDGFIMGLTFCHAICDGLGAAQFLNAVGELARGVHHLTVEPVWQRNFLPQQANPPPPLPPPDNFMLFPDDYKLEQANIDIPFDHINQHKQKFLHQTSSSCSSFEVIAAILWTQRTRAIINNSSSSDYNKEDTNNTVQKLVFFANCRQLIDPPLPKGFYGNCFFPVTITASSETLAEATISDVVKLIQEGKARLPYEFGRWVQKQNQNQNQIDGTTTGGKNIMRNDQQLLQGDPFAPPLGYNTLFVSEWGRLGFNQVDYGKGPPLHVVPMQGSSIIPVAIVASLPRPNKGIRLMTWCVHNPHLHPFLHAMTANLIL